MKKNIKELSTYIGDNILREHFAGYEMILPERIEIEKIVKAEDTYFVNYTFYSSSGYTRRTEVQVEPLELIEMINTKINNFIEKYESTENE